MFNCLLSRKAVETAFVNGEISIICIISSCVVEETEHSQKVSYHIRDALDKGDILTCMFVDFYFRMKFSMSV